MVTPASLTQTSVFLREYLLQCTLAYLPRFPPLALRLTLRPQDNPKAPVFREPRISLVLQLRVRESGPMHGQVVQRHEGSDSHAFPMVQSVSSHITAFQAAGLSGLNEVGLSYDAQRSAAKPRPRTSSLVNRDQGIFHIMGREP